MRLQIFLRGIEPVESGAPAACPYATCRSPQVKHLQTVPKPVKDTAHQAVSAERYRCVRCGRTFRVYPRGVTHDQTTQRVKGLCVFLYLFGLSCGAVSLALEALGIYTARSSVHATVQAALDKVPGTTRRAVLTGIRAPAPGGGMPLVECRGEWLPLGLSADATCLTLTLNVLSAEDAVIMVDWLGRIAQVLDAEVLVADSSDAQESL